MATYKVIQDIEAEDKLIGWLTPRQCIYAAIVLISAFMCFLFATKGVWWLSLPMLPHMILLGTLCAPFVHDQPSEVWLLAKIQFSLKPRRRIWNQSGIKELVTITVPKKIERHLTDGLSQSEVKSRLQALANTIDSRGWAVKNVNVNLFAQPGYAAAGNSDRLLDGDSLPQEVSTLDITGVDDILDEQNNPTAQHLDQMITQSAQTHRQQAVAQMQAAPAQKAGSKQQADYWFLNATAGQQNPVQPGYTTFDRNPSVTPGAKSSTPVTPVAPAPSSTDEEALLNKIHAGQKAPNPSRSHLRSITPMSEKLALEKKKADEKARLSANQKVSPALQQLANNNDLNVSTIARQANKSNPKDPPDDEVVISLR